MAQDAMHPHRTTNKTCYTATRGEFEDMLNKWIADKDLLSSGLAYEICKVPATATMACPQVSIHARQSDFTLSRLWDVPKQTGEFMIAAPASL